MKEKIKIRFTSFPKSKDHVTQNMTKIRTDLNMFAPSIGNSSKAKVYNELIQFKNAYEYFINEFKTIHSDSFNEIVSSFKLTTTRGSLKRINDIMHTKNKSVESEYLEQVQIAVNSLMYNYKSKLNNFVRNTMIPHIEELKMKHENRVSITINKDIEYSLLDNVDLLVSVKSNRKTYDDISVYSLMYDSLDKVYELKSNKVVSLNMIVDIIKLLCKNSLLTGKSTTKTDTQTNTKTNTKTSTKTTVRANSDNSISDTNTSSNSESSSSKAISTSDGYEHHTYCSKTIHLFVKYMYVGFLIMFTSSNDTKRLFVVEKLKDCMEKVNNVKTFKSKENLLLKFKKELLEDISTDVFKHINDTHDVGPKHKDLKRVSTKYDQNGKNVDETTHPL